MLQIDLTGKRVLVTGASSGIGEATADTFAQAGADVAVNYVTHPEAAEVVAQRVLAAGGRSLTLHADVSDASQVDAMFDTLQAEWGGLDVLVNNAGIDGRSMKSWEADLASWRNVIEINLFGAFYCSRRALQLMIPAASGVIVNMSSVHERIPWSGFSAYTSSKAGLAMLTQTLAQEAAPHGVRVLAVAPGAIKTPINKNVWGDPAGLADLDQKIPFGRMGERDEVAHMVVLLASGLASYVTGSTIFVDGGMIDFADFAHGG
jgi:NAD(P)-dependent dehydrogenase (short-subunit alcohol dehydrogenase family)